MVRQTDIFKLYFSHAWRYKPLVLGIAFWMPFLQVLHNIIPPIIAASVLDKLAAGDFSTNTLWADFGTQLVWFTCLTIFTGTIGWRLIIYFVWTLENKVLKDLHNRMFSHFIKLDMDFHNDSFGGSLVSRTSKLVSSYVRITDTIVFELFGLVVVFIATGVVLWPRSPQFVIAIYAFATAFIIISILITKKIRKLSSIEADLQNKATGSLADMITNVLAVKSFSRGLEEEKRHNNVTESVRTASEKLKWSQLHRENVFAFTNSTLTAVALIFATVAVVRYDASVGTVFLMLTYTTQMTVRLWDFSQRALKNINRALGDAQEGVKILQTVPKVLDPIDPVKLPTNSGDIELNDVTFSHEDEELFKNFTLKIKNGEKIGLVGHSGSGKTTLTKLLLRFKDIDNGKILINGVDIRDVTQDNLRSAISYVPQEPMLFHRSLKENISYGKNGATEKQIIAASKAAHAHEFVGKLPQKYETLVGERGVKLSGGQKQRVAIARAMIKDAPILLLDEATSALDSESEQLIQDALWKLMEGRTAIVIAHRLSTIQKMDRIIVLEDGKIIEDGSHNDLIKKKNGQYAQLWAHQSGGFLQD